MAKKKSKKRRVEPQQLGEILRAGPDFVLAEADTAATPGFRGGKKAGRAALSAGAGQLSELQERLTAAARGGGTRSALLVIQGMDTAGKGGIVKHVVGACDPEGVHVASFGPPTAEERAHDFLWRVRRELPRPGQIGVFDRSHYEDVLIVRVHGLVPRATWSRRYATINRFEQRLVDDGTAVVKVMLNISSTEQKRRLRRRLVRPDKWWKYNPADLVERALWDYYQQAYQDVITRCSTTAAPWYVVPADHKWYARWAVQQLLIDALGEIDTQWPPPAFDVAEEKARLARS
jgi:PPK2 family polyphosphate:nucleotide phosphotransferase